jgi:hypothetical protein
MYQCRCHAPCMIKTPFCRHVKSFRPRYISETQNKESFFVHIKSFHPRVLESQITCLFICTCTSKQDCHSLIGPFLKELLIKITPYIRMLSSDWLMKGEFFYQFLVFSAFPPLPGYLYNNYPSPRRL